MNYVGREINGCRAILALSILFALLFGNLAASSASAAGTTAATCHKVGTEAGTFKTEHCKEGDGDGDYAHVPIAQDTETGVSGGSTKTSAETIVRTNFALHLTLTGIDREFKAAFVSATGSLTDKLDPTGGDHYVHGSGTLSFEEITMTTSVGGACAVEGSKIVTKELTATTLGQVMGVKIQPNEGTMLAEFNVVSSGGTCPEAIKGNYKVTGSIVSTPEGATLTFTREGTTAQGTLKAQQNRRDRRQADNQRRRRRSRRYGLPAAQHDNSERSGGGRNSEIQCGRGKPDSGAPRHNSRRMPQSGSRSRQLQNRALQGTDGDGPYAHVPVSQDATTEVTGGSGKTSADTTAAAPTLFHVTVAGVEVDLKAEQSSIVGSMSNKLANNEHFVHGSGVITYANEAARDDCGRRYRNPGHRGRWYRHDGKYTFRLRTGGTHNQRQRVVGTSGVTVTRPEGNGCKVKGGEVVSKELKATTAGQGDAIKIEPASGTLLTSFEVEGCSTGALNGVYEVKGTIKGTPEGATVSFTEGGTTVQNTLTMRSVAAGLEGVLTVAGRVKGSGSNYADISATTVNT